MERASSFVAWLRAPASAANALSRPEAEREGFAARLSLAPVLFAVFAALAVVLVFTTEIYTVREGIGDDGVIYAGIIRNWNGHIQTMGLNGYTAQRCFNPIVMRMALDLFRMSTDNASIVKAYKVANAISMVIAIGCVIAAMTKLRLSRAGMVVATTLTFFNFSTLYWLPFDPVLTDAMALAIGGVQLWAYVSRRHVVLAVASGIGGFVWPSTAQVGAALLFFPRERSGSESENGSESGSGGGPGMVDLGIAAVVAAGLGFYASTLVDYAPPYGQLPAIKSLFRLSCALFCLVAFVALKEMIRVGPSVRQLLRRDRDAIVSKLLAVVMMVAVSKMLAWIAASPNHKLAQADDFTIAEVLKGAVFFAVQRPLVWLVAHVGFFGPGVLLMSLCWRDVCNEARRIGFGLNAVLGLAFFLMLNSQSRAGIEVIPIIMPLAALAAARLAWTPRRLIELAAIVFVASKLWYSIVQKPQMDFSTLMFHIGPWMSHEAYLYQGVAAVLAAVWVLWLKRQRRVAHETVWLCEEQPT